ncbi:preprotein translocase subunit SecD [Steroidobacter denitrificans]|uniref:Protein translocase subunit SecD n=1 Tax=Steroidobacter denitrificans TaxID=465721 RepID=A0A127FAY0_STEDE|nr:protein translocase subunit SecD [Steroidobacter denitrificans]AMN46760.1 preprotein translocase subunit SecD [Steroidobacter denitrificans]
MYQISPWRYWLVGIVVSLGLLLALPNLFGDELAIQLARDDRAAMDASGQARIEGILAAQQVAPSAAYLEDGRLILRFAHVDDQLKARDAINDGTAGDYVVALTSVPRTPAALRKIGLKPMSLGLDLRGGVHFMYEVDVEGAIDNAIQRMAQDIRKQLRDARIAFTAANVEGREVKVTLRPGADLQAARKLIQANDPGISLRNDTQGGLDVLFVGFTPDRVKARQDFAIEQNITTLRNRVDELGVSEPIVARQGVDRIVVQLPGVQDPNQAVRVLGSSATVEFRLVDEANNPYEAQSSKRIPIGSKLYLETDGRPILLKRDVIATGDQLTNATSGFSEGTPEVNVTLDARGGQEMLNATRDNVGRRMAVVYIETKNLAEGEICKGIRAGDTCTEERVISAATIQSVLSSRFRITGLQSAEAHELALLLRSGALAAPQTIVEQRSIGPSLGQDNIDRGMMAMAIGGLLTFLFLSIYYSAFGIVACLVLTVNVMLLVAVMSLLQASLTLPGIAGIVLTIGMAADANVLIYERIREELRSGNSPQAAIHAGFDKAFSAIADSNITTLIAGVALFAFGTGPIKGFAVTLVLGIFTSLFSAILCSRVLIDLIWGRRRRLAALPV